MEEVKELDVGLGIVEGDGKDAVHIQLLLFEGQELSKAGVDGIVGVGDDHKFKAEDAAAHPPAVVYQVDNHAAEGVPVRNGPQVCGGGKLGEDCM